MLLYPVIGCCLGSEFDLAVLLVGGNFRVTPCIPIAETPSVRAKVQSMGYPTTCQKGTFAEGEVRPLVAFSEGEVLANHSGGFRFCWYPTIEFDADISGGMSGGPLGFRFTLLE